MRKFAIFLVLCVFLLASCSMGGEYIPVSGDYGLVCRIGENKYTINVNISEDASGRLTFSEENAMKDWCFVRSCDGKIKRSTSLGEESEVEDSHCLIVKKIFDLVLNEHGTIADVSHEKISGREVSVLKLSDGTEIYTDSESGAPLRLGYGRVSVDIISRPSRGD